VSSPGTLIPAIIEFGSGKGRRAYALS